MRTNAPEIWNFDTDQSEGLAPVPEYVKNVPRFWALQLPTFTWVRHGFNFPEDFTRLISNALSLLGGDAQRQYMLDINHRSGPSVIFKHDGQEHSLVLGSWIVVQEAGKPIFLNDQEFNYQYRRQDDGSQASQEGTDSADTEVADV
jgi:hypothetical protein